jgi:DNA-binding HxlR family transcriptional regulator
VIVTKPGSEYEELRNEISKFRVETKQRLDTIESQLSTQVKLSLNRTAVNYLTSFMRMFIDSMKCEREPDNEKRCKDIMRSINHEFIDLFELGKLRESLSAIDRAISDSVSIKEKFQDEGRTGCVRCFQGEITGLETNRILLKQLAGWTTPSLVLDDDKVLINQIEPSEMNKNFLSPLSHEARLTILKSIYEGNNRFTDFIEKTGLNGGHLIYHLKKLEDGELIQQFASKEYILTNKGLGCLFMVANLSNIS